MRIWLQRSMMVFTALALAGVVGHWPGEAFAKSKSVQSEAQWIAYDADAQTITVKIKKPGRGKAAKKLKKNKPATFRVKAEGSVLTKTTVAVNGRKGELVDIPEGKTVNIYWIPDEKDKDGRFARKIDVIFSEEELDERYPDN